MSCPNKNDPTWKLLVDHIGEIEAYKLFISNGDEIPDEGVVRELLQLSAPNEDLDKTVKSFLDKIGVSVKTLETIVDEEGKPLPINARANILLKTIEVVQGKANEQTLSEEAAHFLVELLGEDNPLFKAMMNRIEKYAIYPSVFNEYKELYKGDIHKIKKEAIGKLIADNIVQNFQGEESSGNMYHAVVWWKVIKNYLSKLFKGIGLEKLSAAIAKDSGERSNPFKVASEYILEGKTEGLKKTGKGSYLQKTNQSDVVNLFKTMMSKITQRTEGERHIYTVDNEEGFKSASELSKENIKTKFVNKSKATIASQEITREAGEKFHRYAADIVREYFPEDNSHLPTLNDELDIEPGDKGEERARKNRNLNLWNQIHAQLKDLIDETKEAGGTLLAEYYVADPKTKVAGTVDLIRVNLNGTVDVFDYKTGKGLYKTKLATSSAQLEEYVRVIENSVIGPRAKVSQKRLIPVGQKKYKDVVVKFEIGEQHPISTERTGIKKLDELISKLQTLNQNEEARAIGGKDKQISNELKKKRIADRDAIVKKLQTTKIIKEVLPIVRQEVAAIGNVIDSPTYDPSTNFADYKRVLSLWATLQTFVPDLKSVDEKTRNMIAFVTGLASEKLEQLNEMSRDVAKDLAYEHNITGQNGIEDVDDLLKPMKDTGAIGRKLLGISASSDPLVQLLHSHTTKALSEARTKTLELKERLTTIVNNIKGKEDNLFQYKDGVKTGNMVEEFTPEFYEEAKLHKEKQDVKWYGTNTVPDTAAFQKARKNFINFLDHLKEQEIENIKASLDPTAEMTGIADPEKIWQKNKKNRMRQWDRENTTPYSFRKPKAKWRDGRWTEVQNDPHLKEAYDIANELRDQASEILGEKLWKSFFPSFRTSLVDRCIDKGLMSTMKNVPKQFLDSLEVKYDENVYGSIDPVTGNFIRRIPIAGIYKIDSEEKSYNFGEVMFLFAESLHRAEELSKIEGEKDMLMDLLHEKKALAIDVLGRPVKRDGEFVAKQGETNEYKRAEAFIDNVFYGQTHVGEGAMSYEVGRLGHFLGVGEVGEEKKLSAASAFDKLLRLVAFKNLGFNLFAPPVNAVAGQANAFFLGATGRYYGKGDLSKALLDLTAGPIGTEASKKAYALIKHFHFHQEEFSREHAHEFKGLYNKILTTDHAFAAMRWGEHKTQEAVFLAMLRSNKFEFKWDNYKLEGDKLLWIGEGTEPNKHIFEKKVLAVNKKVVGNQDQNDMQELKRWWWGRALMQHRGWIPAMVYHRFAPEHYDYILGEYTKGTYRTLVPKTLWSIFKIWAGKGFLFSKMDDFTSRGVSQVDVENMRSNLTELATILSVLILVSIMRGNPDDKERRKQLAYPIKIGSRLVSELSFFASPSSAKQILVSPAAAVSTVTDAGNIMDDLWNLTFQPEGGKKGQKLGKHARKLIPVVGQTERFYDELTNPPSQ